MCWNQTGDDQSVGRGEAEALLWVLKLTVGNRSYVADRKSVVDKWHSKVWQHVETTTSDAAIWREIGRVASERKGVVWVLRHESHVSQVDQDLGYSIPYLLQANKLADELAAEAEARVRVPPGLAEKAPADH